MPKAKTMKIKQGGGVEIDYAKVSSRLAEFLKKEKNASIRTDYEFKEGWVIFKATLVPDITDFNRFFNGTSMGKTDKVKAFEKLETIAVGRALAFAGYLSSGEIASEEEMEVFYDDPVVTIDIEPALTKLGEAKDIKDLQKIWGSLTQQERDDSIVEAKKDYMKGVLPGHTLTPSEEVIDNIYQNPELLK